MRNSLAFQCFALLFIVLSIGSKCILSLTIFSCPSEKGDRMPMFPKAFSADIRLNFPRQLYTAEMKHFVDIKGKREAVEIWSPQRHVKYILHGKQLLLIEYPEDMAPTCTVKSSEALVLEDKDAGPNMILEKLDEVLYRDDAFSVSTPSIEAGIYLRKWEACFKDPSINVSMGFTEVDWNYPRTPASFKNQKYLVLMEAQIKSDYLVAAFNNFDPTMPDDVNFQPPENTYCKGLRSDRKLPSMPNSFSYDSEIIVFESAEGISPMVSRRKVYYDYDAKIVRTDFYDPLAENPDLFSKISAKATSIVHDFNSSIQYTIDPTSGKCSVEDYMITVDVVEAKETKDTPMLKGNEFFSLDARQISYNGQFMTRGYLADVYTALVPHLDGSEGKSFYAWYFSAVRTQIVEKDRIEKNVLLRMVIQPEAQVGYQGMTYVNFYNFQKEEPNALVYDITSCYNQSHAKTFVITFPANNLLRGSEQFCKLPIHLALKDATGLSKQRIFVSEVLFNEKYMFAEFTILDAPSVLKKSKNSDNVSLQEVVNKLKKDISENKFKLTIEWENNLIVLKPEPNGFNEFSGDRHLEQQSGNKYKEGSVIALVVGMLFLGFVLGGILVNLIISRKYGVSLFQNKSGMNRFGHPLNESSM